MSFKKAERKKVKLKLAVTGPSGSGKTYSGLLLAKGLAGGGKVAVIDTENGSASLYADKFEFDVLNIDPPYTTQKYVNAIKEAEKEKYSVVLIDSLTHAWAGEGGLLAKKEAMDQRGGNSFTNWSTITKEHELFKAEILASDIHVVCTMRSKQEYAMGENEKGKQSVKKLGMAPIQREGMEYEFTTVFDIAMNHEFEVSKDRTGLFAGRFEKLTEKHGEELLAWLESAKVEPQIPDVIFPQAYKGVKSLAEIYKLAGLDGVKDIQLALTAKESDLNAEWKNVLIKTNEWIEAR